MKDIDEIDYRRRYGEVMMRLTSAILDKSLNPPEWLLKLINKDLHSVLYNEELEQNELKKKHGDEWKTHYDQKSTI